MYFKEVKTGGNPINRNAVLNSKFTNSLHDVKEFDINQVFL